MEPARPTWCCATSIPAHSRSTISCPIPLWEPPAWVRPKGVDQPTGQSALLRGGKVEPLRSYKGEDKGGDGTVPRPSSHPPEWKDERASTYVSQKHAVLQSTDSILTQILGMLTGHLGRFMGGARIGFDVPDVVQLGSSVPIEATSQDGDP